MNAPTLAKHLSPQAGEVPVDHDLAEQLSRRLRSETQAQVLWSAADRGRYATDASIYQVTPVGVLVPQTMRDVEVALQICRELGVPIVPRGAGTSQCGQTVGVGLVIDFSKHLNAVSELDLKASTVRVQPGVVLDHLNAQLKAHGLWYPVDVSTSAQATLGGMAGNNSCGSRSLAYGNMVHNVEGLRAWLSSGESVDFGYMDHSSGKALEIGRFVQTLAEGLSSEIDERWPSVLRRVAGYNLDIFRPKSERPYNDTGRVNLAHLLIGSEGTLGLTESLKLRLSPLPTHKVLGVVNFPTFYDAMSAPQHIVKMGGRLLSAVELVDKTMIDLSLQNPAFAPTIRTALSPHINSGAPAAVLLVEFSGDSQPELLAKLKELVELMADLGLPGSVVEMPQPSAQKNLWEVRKAGLNIMMSLKGDGKPVSFIEDCAVPLESLAEYTSALTDVFAKHGTHGTWYAHASVGTLHVRPILDMRRDGPAKMRAIAQEAAELVAKYKGAYSGEHGDGLCRGEWIEWQFGPKINEAFKAIKEHMDPLNLLSPRRIINPPKMDDQGILRFPSAYKVIPLKTALDWSAWNVQNDPVTGAESSPGSGADDAQGFAKAVEMCNNNGHCRKFDAGTMCPSYRVTRDEMHLTRGRANTLRLALSGQLRDGENGSALHGLSSQAVQDALDLCVGCKGCKRDCPTGVDMAKMKIEATYHYKQAHGFTWKDRLIGHLPKYAALASRFAWLLNLRNKSPILAKLSQALFGFAEQRSLPTWHASHFFNTPNSGVTKEALLSAPDLSRCVVLFVDTFNGYFESGGDNARAALRVLQRAGYTVHVLSKDGLGSSTGASGQGANEHLCCGRTYLSVGMVPQARASMSRLLDHLEVFADRHIPIVGLEPSCLLTLRDEALAMGLGEKAQKVAALSQLFEEFLAKENSAGRLDLLKRELKAPAKPLRLHGHCHQKAFDVMDTVLQSIHLLPGAQASLIESSCCGMAGSFGYDKDHYDISIKMAEAKLLPALRQEPDCIVVAGGTSCRHQIEDTLSRQAVHVAKLLSDHLP
jgi:FAD/FMN-containing dehydrogenase/Fe-S oxidoreductase